MVPKKRKKKDSIAVRLGRRGGLARSKNLSAIQRRVSARAAIMARWHGKKKPTRWWLLVAIGQDPDHPEVIAWSQDKNELTARALKENRNTAIVDVEYNPSGFALTPMFEPDLARQTEALTTLAHLEEGGRS